MKRFVIATCTLFFVLTAIAEAEPFYWTYDALGGTETFTDDSPEARFMISCSASEPIDYMFALRSGDSYRGKVNWKRLDVLVDGKYRFNNIQNTLNAKVAIETKDLLEKMHFAKQSIVVIADGKPFNLPIKNSRILPTYSTNKLPAQTGEKGKYGCYTKYFFKYGAAIDD